MDLMEDDQDDMDIGDLDLDGLEKAVQVQEQGVSPSHQVVLLKESNIKNINYKTLGVGNKNPGIKIHETIKKLGSERNEIRSNQQCIKHIGEKLVASRQFPTREAAFSLPYKPSQ